MPDIQTNSTPPSVKLLIIRFSSFGDIVQALGVPQAFRAKFPHAEIDWLVRQDLKGLVDAHPEITRVIPFDRRDGLSGLLSLSWQLAHNNYTHIYDAHNNVRSLILRLSFFFLGCLPWLKGPRARVVTRPKNRLRRFLFFRCHWRSAIAMPFRPVLSFLGPLQRWQIHAAPPAPPQFHVSTEAYADADRHLQTFSNIDVALVPSAAWELKRWPIDHWKQLILLLPGLRFVVLGGPSDDFCAEIAAVAPDRVLNLAGRLSLQASAAIVDKARLVVTGDTGLLHVADQLGRPTLALIGPTAFGYPTNPASEVIEIAEPLRCKPCSKDGSDPCTHPTRQMCMVAIEPTRVAERVRFRLQRDKEKDVNWKTRP